MTTEFLRSAMLFVEACDPARMAMRRARELGDLSDKLKADASASGALPGEVKTVCVFRRAPGSTRLHLTIELA